MNVNKKAKVNFIYYIYIYTHKDMNIKYKNIFSASIKVTLLLK